MFGGLSLHHHALVATAAAALMGCLFAPATVEAADLGGDCCADLEERVAELEATTVRKGNKKVKVELYGRMNRVINFWNDGAESNVYSLNNSYNTEPLRHQGQGKDQRRLVERLRDRDRGHRQSEQVRQPVQRQHRQRCVASPQGRDLAGEQDLRQGLARPAGDGKGQHQQGYHCHQGSRSDHASGFLHELELLPETEGLRHRQRLLEQHAALPGYRPLLLDEQLGLRLLDPPQ